MRSCLIKNETNHKIATVRNLHFPERLHGRAVTFATQRFRPKRAMVLNENTAQQYLEGTWR